MNFKEIAAQLVALYHRLNKVQKIIIALTLAAVLGFVVFIVLYAGIQKEREYTVLFDQLDAKDAALIIQQLEQDEVPYKIPEDDVIEVPKSVVYKERIALASLGLPKNSRVGYELFDKQEFGSTDFDKQVKFLRALEGELATTIESLVPIKRAVVHLALPKESVFVAKEVQPSASVTVTIHEGLKLGRKQVAGIKNLVASSVPKLLPENVQLINALGEPLGADDESSLDSEIAQAQLRYRRQNETLLEQKIVNVLAPIIGGRDRVVAKVSVSYDFAQRNSTQELYDPENVVRSEQTLDEKREGQKEAEVGGVPGAVSNIGPVQGMQDSGRTQKYEKSTTTTNYEISKTVSNIKGPFATIKRLTAAVVVDGKYPVAEGDVRSYQNRTPEEIAQLTELAKQAVGFDGRRGDEVTVTNFQFETLAEAPGDTLTSFMDKLKYYAGPFMPLIKLLVLMLVLFIFYKKVVAPFAQRMLEVSTEEEEGRPILQLDEEEEESLSEKFAEMRKKVEGQLGIGEELNEDGLKYEILLDKIRGMAEEKPEELAALLQALIRDEGDLEQAAAKKVEKVQ